MKSQVLVSVYALTLLLSAILLFSVQPMFTKMVLPLLGGAPQVWNTAMLFFQACLLGGYAYAHLTSYFLPIKIQGLLHILLLGLFSVVLPFAIPAGWEPPASSDPTIWQITLMAITVGGPFFIIAGSAPMLQHWFAKTDHKDAGNPYFLYGASNLGSMTALLSYPFLVEPLWALNSQTLIWMSGYIGLIIATFLCLLLVWKDGNISKGVHQPAEKGENIAHAVRIRWIMLTAAPSALMLGVTTYITTDIATVPLFWVIPLALYVGTFIIVFVNKPLFKTDHIHIASGLSIIALVIALLFYEKLRLIPLFSVPLHLTVFFLITLSCHQELADSKPKANKLTEFYMLMSLGGVLGGFFSAIIVPKFFIIPFEYALILSMAVLLRYTKSTTQTFSDYVFDVRSSFVKINILTTIALLVIAFTAYQLKNNTIEIIASIALFSFLYLELRKRWTFGMLVFALLMLSPIGPQAFSIVESSIFYRDRNYFGSIAIKDIGNMRTLIHGTTNHGTQALKESEKLIKVSYFSDGSPLSDVFSSLQNKKGYKQKIAVLGLGIGVMACYKQEGREFDFYEIDKVISDIAENRKFFTYLSDCGSPYKIILGDARLKIEKVEDQKYDMIILDVFSSDNIPVHLITLEAIKLYISKIKPEGIIAAHITNNYLDIEAVMSSISEELKISALSRAHNGGNIDGTDLKAYPSQYFVFTNNQNVLNKLTSEGWSVPLKRDGVRLWTDQYTNIVSIFGNKSFHKRMVDDYNSKISKSKY